jgi:microcystin-dependent protein
MASSEIAVSTTPPLPGTALVAQVNAALQSVATQFSGSVDPAEFAGAYMLWADTATDTLKRRDSTNSNWVEVGPLFGSGGFPSGTKMLFAQTSAPAGWTKSTTHDNKALRVVSGTAGSGGSVEFTTAFASKVVSGTTGSTTATNNAATTGGTVGNHTLTVAQMPSHQHLLVADQNFASTNLTASNQFPREDEADGYPDSYSLGGTTAAATIGRSSLVGSNGAHSHSFSGSSHNHTQNAHTHTFTGTAIDLAVQYVDVIIATKD